MSLAGTTVPLQKLTADVNINDISGSWVAGKKAVELNSKAGVYPLADGFSWNDMRGKAMWKDGSQVMIKLNLIQILRSLFMVWLLLHSNL